MTFAMHCKLIMTDHSGKTSITLNALLFLEHAASHQPAGEAEHSEGDS